MNKYKDMLPAIVLWLCSVTYTLGFPETAGNCNGLYGVHLPNSEGGGDGGYRIKLSDASVASNGHRVAKIAIEHLRYDSNISEEIRNATLGSGLYAGFLIKSYDPYTGLPLGAFQQPLPPYTVLYTGCSPAESAVSHSLTDKDIEDGVQYGDGGPLELSFAWPATRSVLESAGQAACACEPRIVELGTRP